ncbi:MAG TPA: PAS domain-containing protein [Victivallales bacterium]|nr:PAS domain-containing protein [Victivallales bacterium]
MPAGLIIRDIETEEQLYINKTASKIFGCPINNLSKALSNSSLINRYNGNVRSPKALPPFSKRNGMTLQFKIVRGDGKERYLEISYSIKKFKNKKCILSVIKDITEMKNEEEIRELLEINVEAMPYILEIRNIETRNLLYTNNNTKSITGYSPADFRRNKNLWKSIIHPDFKSQYIKDINIIPLKASSEIKIITKSGEEKWLEITRTKSNFRGIDCKISVGKDITEKKHEEEVRELLEINVDSMPEGLLIRDLKSMKCLYGNSVIESIYGRSLDELFKIGFDSSIILPKEEQIRYKTLPQFKKRDGMTLQFRIIRGDGKIRWVEFTYKYILYRSIKCILSIIKDITETKKKEEIRSLLDINVDAMSDGIVIVDKNECKYVYINKTIEKIYGYSRNDFYSKGLDFWYNTCLYPDSNNKIFLETKDNRFASGKRSYKTIRADGEIRWISSVRTNHKIDGKEYYVAVDRDITEEKMEPELQELETNKRINNKIIKVVKCLLKENINISIISKSTELSVEQIQKIKLSLIN